VIVPVCMPSVDGAEENSMGPRHGCDSKVFEAWLIVVGRGFVTIQCFPSSGLLEVQEILMAGSIRRTRTQEAGKPKWAR
jgi:hypothetical protein